MAFKPVFPPRPPAPAPVQAPAPAQAQAPAPLPAATPRIRVSKRVARQAGIIIACRIQGMSDADIAHSLGLEIVNVRRILQRARASEILNDLPDRIEHRAVHTAVDNLIEGLDQKDKDYTLATLRGTGIFKVHSAVKSESDQHVSNELKVVFEMPTGATVLPQVAVGSILANPRRITAPPIPCQGDAVQE